MLSSGMLHLVLVNVSVLRKTLQVSQLCWLGAVVRRDLFSCIPGCGAVATGQSGSAAELNQAEVSDPANTGVLQSQGQWLGLGGENFLV